MRKKELKRQSSHHHSSPSPARYPPPPLRPPPPLQTAPGPATNCKQRQGHSSCLPFSNNNDTSNIKSNLPLLPSRGAPPNRGGRGPTGKIHHHGGTHCRCPTYLTYPTNERTKATPTQLQRNSTQLKATTGCSRLHCTHGMFSSFPSSSSPPSRPPASAANAVLSSGGTAMSRAAW